MGGQCIQVVKLTVMANDFTLKRLPNYSGPQGPLLVIVLDGFGIGHKNDSDCVYLADPTYMLGLRHKVSIG